MSSATNETIRTYFWMVHYGDPAATAGDADLKPIAAGRNRWVVVISRNAYANRVIDFSMPREREGFPDPATFRGAPGLRNRIVGFYASAEEANAHMNDTLWAQLRDKAGAVYAELHSMKIDIADAKSDGLKLVA